MILLDISNKNGIACIYDAKLNKINIKRLFTIDYQDSYGEITNLVIIMKVKNI